MSLCVIRTTNETSMFSADYTPHATAKVTVMASLEEYNSAYDVCLCRSRIRAAAKSRDSLRLKASINLNLARSKFAFAPGSSHAHAQAGLLVVGYLPTEHLLSTLPRYPLTALPPLTLWRRSRTTE